MCVTELGVTASRDQLITDDPVRVCGKIRIIVTACACAEEADSDPLIQSGKPA